MGAQTKRVTTQNGVEVLRVEAEGLLDEATTQQVVPAIMRSQLPVLMVLGSGLKLSPGARKGLMALDSGTRDVPVALVAQSVMMRTMMSMVIKGISIAKRHEVISATFGDERAAMAWLETQSRRMAA